MQNPIREQIKLDGRWQVRQVDERSVSVFVPGSWTDKSVVLREGEGHPLEAVTVDGEPLQPATAEGGWQTEPGLKPGEWNAVSTQGELTGATLVAGDDLHITDLTATPANRHSLSVRVRLSGSAGEAPGPKIACLLSLYFTLSAADGSQIGALDLVVGNKTRELSVEMPVQDARGGAFRLKATLCCGDRIVDNARIDLQL